MMTLPVPLGRALTRAVLAAAAFALAARGGPAVGAALTDAAALAGLPARLLSAALTSALAVPLVLLLVRAAPGARTEAGLIRLGPSAGAFTLGVAVTAGSALAVLGAGTAADWVRWGHLDPGRLLAFVVTNGLVALLLEALPEELTLRGVAWGSLRSRFGAGVAALGTTALFLLVPWASTAVYAATTAALGRPAPPVTLAPPGEGPVAYLVLLTIFGLTLVAARIATPTASVWTCVGSHLTVLTVNRVLLAGEQRGAGWSATLASPDAVLLVPAYLAAAGLAFWLLARRRRVAPSRLRARLVARPVRRQPGLR